EGPSTSRRRTAVALSSARDTRGRCARRGAAPSSATNGSSRFILRPPKDLPCIIPAGHTRPLAFAGRRGVLRRHLAHRDRYRGLVLSIDADLEAVESGV